MSLEVAPLDKLVTLLNVVERGAIAIALFDKLATRRELVAALRIRVERAVHEVHLSERERNPIDLIRALKPKRGEVVCLFDIERAFPESLGYLDLQREVLTDLDISVVIWVTVSEHRELVTRAPNFYAVRSGGVFDFTNRPPRVFISYSHDSRVHEDRVLALADRLRDEGVDCCLDQYQQSPTQGWAQWMLDEIAAADFVLVVCTQTYTERFERRAPSGRGRGSKWEGAVITLQLYQDEALNHKFVPVVFGRGDVAHIPHMLSDAQHYRVNADDGYQQLYRRLTNQPYTPKPALGQARTLPPRERATSFIADEPERGTSASPPDAATEERAPNPPDNLPPLPAGGLVGRARQLDELGARLRTGGVAVIKGEGGIGKSALAVTAARRALDEGLFAGGAVWLACETKPLLDDLLATTAATLLGRSAAALPPVDRRTRLDDCLRSLPCLLVFDNFETVHEDIELARLIKTVTSPSAALVTSRTSVPFVGGHTVNLPELSAGESAELFLRRARDAGWTGDGGPLVDMLCKLVGHLPLAIELLAPRAAELSLATLRDLVTRSLDALTAHDDPTLRPEHRSIAACFGVSFDRLSLDAQNLLKRLSLLPDGASEHVIGGYTGIPRWHDPVAACVRHSLLRFDGAKYRFHPLVQRFAQQRLADESGDALGEWQRELVVFYRQLVVENHEINNDQQRAVLDAEWRNALAAAEVGNTLNEWEKVVDIATSLTDFLQRRGLWAAGVRLNESALSASLSSKKPDLEGIVRNNLGIFFHCQRRYDEALATYERSRQIKKQLHDEAGEALTLNNVGIVCHHQGKLADAVSAFQESLTIKRSLGDRRGVAATLTNLADVHLDMGLTEKAEEAFRASVDIYHELGDEYCEGAARCNLGKCLAVCERWTEAEEEVNYALRVYRKFGNPTQEGYALEILAKFHFNQGKYERALDFAQHALDVLETTEDQAATEEVRALLADIEAQLGQRPKKKGKRKTK